MNLQDKLHERVFALTPVANEPIKTGLYIVTNGVGFFEVQYDSQYKFHEEFTDCSGVTHYLNPTPEPSYLLTPLELLELRKKWASEDWDAAFKKSGENMIDHVIEISNPAPDKETYINSLTL